MSLRGSIDEALKNAQKAREADRVSTLRLMRAAIQADDIARRGEGRSEAGEADILHVGDTFWNGIYPFIDYSTGGSIDGMIAAAAANVATATDSTVIIAGHGRPLGTRAELREFHDMLATIRDNVATLKRQGRSREETVAAKPTARFDAVYGQFVIDPAFFTRLVYEGV